jgi:signal transduction histidine kinase
MGTNDGEPGPRWPHLLPLPEWRITAAYVAAAAAWVVLSDRAVGDAGTNPTLSVQTFKGLNFVATTAVLLYFVLRSAYRGWRHAERKNHELAAEMSDCLRLLCARTEVAREEERTRLSRELHDQLGQALTGLKMDLRWIEGRLEQANRPDLNPLVDRLVDAGEQAQAMIVQVQAIAADLRPDALDQLGLSAAIEQEAKRFTQRTGIPCRVVVEVPEWLPANVALAAFRILQEALTNVMRHAGASEVTVTCSPDENALTLVVADDGKGMPEAAGHGRKALGILGMRERAELCGGRFGVSSRKGGGTEVTARLPWNQAPVS